MVNHYFVVALCCLICSLGSVHSQTTPTPVITSAPTLPPPFAPTAAPSASPNASPTTTTAPTAAPTTGVITFAPTAALTNPPTLPPPFAPSAAPTAVPASTPTTTVAPSAAPTAGVITFAPTAALTNPPTLPPPFAPSAAPTVLSVTSSPTAIPSANPTASPTASPTAIPTADPTAAPTASPTEMPTATPTEVPTAAPSETWTSSAPTYQPSRRNNRKPVHSVPTFAPSYAAGVPTPTPTMKPTCGDNQPTPRPSSSAPVKVHGSQRCRGIDYASWNSDPKCELSFRQAVAMSCGGHVDYTGVTVMAVADVSSSVSDSSRFVAESTSEIEITFVISQTVFDFDDETSAYDNITATLADNVNSGYMTSYIQAFADSNGASSMSNVTATSFDVISTNSPTLSPTTGSATVTSSSSSKGLSTADIIVIAVVVPVGSLIIAGVAWFMCCGSQNGGKANRPTPNPTADNV